MVAFPHIDVLNKLASLVNVHFLVYVTNMGIHGMRRYHQFVRDIRCGVSSGDKFKDFSLALRKCKFVDDLFAHYVYLRWACRCAN